MDNENISKYLPLAVSGLALILGLSNNKKTRMLESRCRKGFNDVADMFEKVDNAMSMFDDNFKIVQRDLNKLGHFVGFKGRLGVND